MERYRQSKGPCLSSLELAATATTGTRVTFEGLGAVGFLGVSGADAGQRPNVPEAPYSSVGVCQSMAAAVFKSKPPAVGAF